jgi:hypothetical protein
MSIERCSPEVVEMGVLGFDEQNGKKIKRVNAVQLGG